MQPRVNFRIKAAQVRVIGPTGEQLGVMLPEEAVKKAEELGYDLVEVAPTVTPPVCRIMDYGKFKYEQSKKQHASRAHQKAIHVKEVKLRPHTSQHDIEVKVKHLLRFLELGHRVRVIVRFRGREIAYPEHARTLLAKVAQEVTAHGAVELMPRFDGKTMLMVLAPKA